MNDEYRILTGNEAVAIGAVDAGCSYFAGYPISPATEILEELSRRLPELGRSFMQMEDELASITSCIGAAFAGAKVMTATSGPGFALMQEGLAYARYTEAPLVIVDVERDGLSQGSQAPINGDIMMTKWGTHGGNHPAVTIMPNSVEECYYETVHAFNISEQFRVPVIILSDSALGHMSEGMIYHDPAALKIVDRKAATAPKDRSYLPYKADEDGVPPMACFGDGHRWVACGIVHNETGRPFTQDPKVKGDLITRLNAKIADKPEIEHVEEYMCEDAEYLFVVAGLVSRSAKLAVKKLRAQGVKAGMFRPVTVWPFPEKRLGEVSAGKKAIVTVEMNGGQIYEVVRGVARETKIVKLARYDGNLITAEEIVDVFKKEV